MSWFRAACFCLGAMVVNGCTATAPRMADEGSPICYGAIFDTADHDHPDPGLERVLSRVCYSSDLRSEEVGDFVLLMDPCDAGPHRLCVRGNNLSITLPSKPLSDGMIWRHGEWTYRITHVWPTEGDDEVALILRLNGKGRIQATVAYSLQRGVIAFTDETDGEPAVTMFLIGEHGIGATR